MGKKKIKQCENIDFLPTKFQEELKEMSDKNILSTLCYDRLRYSDYAKANDGFFFTSLAELAKESNIDDSTLKRRLILLEMKKYIQRKSGTNHHCTHYKLSKEIENLLGIEDDEKIANAPLDKLSIDIDKNSIDIDKISLDETSKVSDKQSIDNNNIEEQFQIDKKILLNKIEEVTNGMDFNAIESIKIPLSNFITSNFSNEIDRLKKILYITLDKKKDKIRNEILVEAMSSSSTDDGLPF